MTMTGAADNQDTIVTTALCPEHEGRRHQVFTDGANLLSCAEPAPYHDADFGAGVEVGVQTCQLCPATRTIYDYPNGTGVSEGDGEWTPCHDGTLHLWP